MSKRLLAMLLPNVLDMSDTWQKVTMKSCRKTVWLYKLKPVLTYTLTVTSYSHLAWWPSVNNWRRMWDMAVCLHNAETCCFNTLFYVSVVMHVTLRDVSVTQWRKIMRHLSYKSLSFAKRNVPITARHLWADWRKLRYHFPGLCSNVFWCFIRKSRGCHVTVRQYTCHTTSTCTDRSTCMDLNKHRSVMCAWVQGVCLRVWYVCACMCVCSCVHLCVRVCVCVVCLCSCPKSASGLVTMAALQLWLGIFLLLVVELKRYVYVATIM